jgi:hypothetical protein
MSANGLHHELLISVNGRKCRLRKSAKGLLNPVLLTKASSVPKYHQLPLVVTEAQVRSEDRVSAARPAVRAVRRGYVLPLPLRCRETLLKCREVLRRHREALLKAKAVPEAMLRRAREIPEINSADSTGRIFSDNMELI